MIESSGFLDRLTLSWSPKVDICETAAVITVSLEVPGVLPEDLEVTVRGNELLIRGWKREPVPTRRLLCYYCIERRYGRFERRLSIGPVIDGRRSRAHLSRGILKIRIPKLRERRGVSFNIPIRGKER